MSVIRKTSNPLAELRKCSSCGKRNDRIHQRYCLACHNGYMRTWRKTHPMTPEQKYKDNARSYAHTYLRRGKIQRTPCVVCNEHDAEMHHHDYSKPLDVIWLCRPCHMEHHKAEKEVVEMLEAAE